MTIKENRLPLLSSLAKNVRLVDTRPRDKEKIQHEDKVVPRVFIPGERRKIGALQYGICLDGLDFLVFSFSSCSCEIRLLQCLRFGLPDATLNALTFQAIICFRFLTA